MPEKLRVLSSNPLHHPHGVTRGDNPFSSLRRSRPRSQGLQVGISVCIPSASIWTLGGLRHWAQTPRVGFGKRDQRCLLLLLLLRMQLMD